MPEKKKVKPPTEGGSYADGKLVERTKPAERKPDPETIARRQAREEG
jgi:hypothetical protein